jgi:predicted amidohydrolase
VPVKDSLNKIVMKKIFKVAVVEWSKKDTNTFIQTESLAENLVSSMEYNIKKALEHKAVIIVFPAFTGCLYQLLKARPVLNDDLHFISEYSALNSTSSGILNSTLSNTPNTTLISTLKYSINNEDCFLKEIISISKKYNILICPGSYWAIDKTYNKQESGCQNDNPESRISEYEGYEDYEDNKLPINKIYHESCIVSNGNIILNQRQIYLAKWERKLGLSRGTDVELIDINGWNIGIILSTDVFYPQVSRKLALMGVDIVISPVGFIGEKNMALQISGMWQETQQNLFFALESGFNGGLGEIELWGESIIHAPLEMTKGDYGILERTNGKENLIIYELDNDMRKAAISKFNVLEGLNRELYNNYNNM